MNVEICKSGEIYWNYPKGKGLVLFRSTDGDFRLCITPDLGGFQSYTRTDTNEVFTISDYGDKGLFVISILLQTHSLRSGRHCSRMSTTGISRATI